MSIAKNKRCEWPSGNELMTEYHDNEWGVPVHDDRKHFEFFVLDAFQAGLSWLTILKKRENFRKAFAGFDFVEVARFNEQDFERLMQDAGIIRNRLKISATINNANRFLEIIDEFGSFDRYIWSFVEDHPVVNKWNSLSEIPASSPLSDRISKDLKKRGFKFVGSTIVYAYLQAAGLVNDHTVSCYRYDMLIKKTD